MNTPIADFVKGYEKMNMDRLHMPGHKGKSFLGCEAFDITEVNGADALYEADGIIAESEVNATSLFGTKKTIYSTEGSSQCIRAMLYLALMNKKPDQRPVVVAARNVHKAFVYAAALLDLEVVWIYPEGDMRSLCSCEVKADSLRNLLDSMQEPPIAVYVTSPDYLGGQLDIGALAKVCYEKGTILAVDNAHGAYLHFTDEKSHPIDLGADICCDSAHKTLPVLTGGAYLQIGNQAPDMFAAYGKQAMALFGSTSPSYLILSSLDLCNQYLVNNYKKRLKNCISNLDELKLQLQKQGWQVEPTEPLKLTLCVPDGMTGQSLAEKLRKQSIECEYADPEYLVCMFTPEIDIETYKRIADALGKNTSSYSNRIPMQMARCEQKVSIRKAIFTEHERVKVKEALGRICASPAVSCPPAIPIVVSGEEVSEAAIKLFEHYGLDSLDVVKRKEEEL